MRSRAGRVVVISLILLVGWMVSVAGAQTAENEKPGEEATIAELKAKIQALQRRVEELEKKGRAAESESERSLFSSATPTAWDPWAEMDRMQAEMTRLFQDVFKSSRWQGLGMLRNNLTFETQVNMEETPQEYVFHIDLSGLDPQNIRIDIQGQTLTLQGQQKEDKGERSPSHVYQERRYSSFLQSLALPPDADTSQVKTENTGKELIIHIPKRMI